MNNDPVKTCPDCGEEHVDRPWCPKHKCGVCPGPCTECEGSSHHWIENQDDSDEVYWHCKHCPVKVPYSEPDKHPDKCDCPDHEREVKRRMMSELTKQIQAKEDAWYQWAQDKGEMLDSEYVKARSAFEAGFDAAANTQLAATQRVREREAEIAGELKEIAIKSQDDDEFADRLREYVAGLESEKGEAK